MSSKFTLPCFESFRTGAKWAPCCGEYENKMQTGDYVWYYNKIDSGIEGACLNLQTLEVAPFTFKTRQ